MASRPEVRHDVAARPGVGDAAARNRRRDRAVVRGAFAAAIVRLITAMTSFATLGIAARSLSKNEFGLVAMVISIWLVLTMFDLGIGGALTTRVAASHARDDLVEMRAHVNHALLVLTGVGGFIALAGTVSAVTLPWHAWIGGDVASSTLVRSLVITFVVCGMALPAAVGFLCLTGMQRFATAQSGIAAGGVLAVVASAAAAVAGASAEAFILAMIGGPVAVSLGFTVWVVHGLLRGPGSPDGFKVARFTSMLRASGFYAVFNAANTVSIGTSTLIVGSVHGLAAAAVFSVAIRLFSPIIIVLGASGAQLWPSMTEAISRGDVLWARSRYRRGLIYVTAISSAASLALVGVGPWLAELWVGPTLVPTRGLMAWAAVFSVVVAVTSQANVVVMAVERLRMVTALSVVAAVVSVTSSILLTRNIGVAGALIGATAAFVGILLPGIVLVARNSLRAMDPTQTARLYAGLPDTDGTR